MRKLLLATTAIVGFAGAAQAAEAPIQVELGGSVDFRAALFKEATKDRTGINTDARRGDFQTEYEINISASGKSGGLEYGAFLNLDNDAARDAQEATMDLAYVWMQGSYGKFVLGDHYGASELMVFAPTVGNGQINGDYGDFTTVGSRLDMSPIYIDTEETSTKVYYVSPKVGSEDHKVQLGVSFASDTGKGTTATLYDVNYTYKNEIEAILRYEGQFGDVSAVLTPGIMISDAYGNRMNVGNGARDFTGYGTGLNLGYKGFTLGGSYMNAGHAATATTEDRNQDVWTFGLSYECESGLDLAVNYLTGEGYFRIDGTRRYVDSYDALGLGAAYTWFPGMTTAADAVFYNRNRADTGRNDVGHVLMLSQKMSF